MLGKNLLVAIVVLLSLLLGFVGYASYKTFNDSLVLEDRELENGSKIKWTDCWFNAHDPAFQQYKIFCGRLHTAPSKVSHESEFKLPVVVIRYQAFDYKDNPVLFMAGGPGSSVLVDGDNIKDYWLRWIKKTNLKRDLILFDQRGSGMSDPVLRCPNLSKAITEIMSRSATPEENAKYRFEALKQCADYLRKGNYPINELGTTYSAEDVRDLMKLLGYKQWNIQGVSYSTRLAMEVQRIAPEYVRTMVLDSVYPVNKHLFKEWPALLDQSIERILEYCENSSTCPGEFGDIRTKLWELVARLQTKPYELKLPERNQFKIDKVVINDETLLAILFDAQYHSGALFELPALIDAFHSDDVDVVRPYILEYISYQFDSSFSEAVFWSVECNDNKAFTKEETSKIYKEFPRLRRYLVEDYDACEIWTSPNRRILQPVKPNNDTPVLILAGEDDPVTPSEWAGETVDYYPQSYLFSFGGIAHSVLDSMPCSIDLFRQFINKPERRPAADCREGYVYFPE